MTEILPASSEPAAVSVGSPEESVSPPDSNHPVTDSFPESDADEDQIEEADMFALYVQMDKLKGFIEKEHAKKKPWYPILEELVRTEDQYLSDISSIVKCYIPKFSELQEQFPAIITPETSQKIFINLEEIKDFHQCFYQELKPLLKVDSLELVGKLFQEQAERFKIYSEYCSKHSHSVDLLVKLTKHKTIDIVLRSVQTSLQHPLNLSTYLLKPVQRVLKYKLLLQSMLKHSGVDTPAHLMLSTAAERMDSIAKEINELKALSENKQILEELQDGLDSTPFAGSLHDFGTIHLQDTMLDLKAAKSRQERMVILMDNALLICKVREKQVRQARSTGKSLRGRKSPYKYKDLIKLTELTFTQDDHVKKDDLAFLVHKQHGRTMTTYCLRAKSVVKKNHWVSTLQDLILSSFHFAPDMLEQIMNTLKYSTLSLNPQNSENNTMSRINSLGRNMKLIPISQSVNSIGHKSYSDEEITRPQSMYDYIDVSQSVQSHNVSGVYGELYCEKEAEGGDEVMREQVRRYSRNIEIRSRPRLPTPADADKEFQRNPGRDSGISDVNNISKKEVKQQMQNLINTMQKDYDKFQDSTRERDSGLGAEELPTQLDFMTLKMKHEGMVQSLVKNYMSAVTRDNEKRTQQDTRAPLPLVPPLLAHGHNTDAKQRANLPHSPKEPQSSPLSSPKRMEKPPVSPKPPHLKSAVSPHHKVKYNSLAPPKSRAARKSLPDENLEHSDEPRTMSAFSLPPLSPGLELIGKSPKSVIGEDKGKVSGMASQWEKTIKDHKEECAK